MLSKRKMILSMSPKNQRLWFYHAQDYFFCSSIILHIFTSPLCINTNYCLFFSKGNAIQGSTKFRDTAHFASIITKGGYYEVKNFYTFENQYINTVVSHEAVIDLKSDTKVTRLDSLPLSIPRYYFNFTDFTHVFNKGKESRLLTSVLHCYPSVANCIMHNFFIWLT